MKNERSEILDRLGKDPGFKVPEGYFDNFAEQMLDKLPEVEITEVDIKPSMWVRVRPYVYMAAMFAGVWCMMHVFSNFNTSISGEQRVSELSKQLNQDENIDEFIMSGAASDYDIISYEDSVNMDLENDQQ